MIKVIKFVKKEAVLFISLAAALISMIFTPPNPEYLGYVDWSTLGLLFCLMAAVQGFGSIGAFSRLAGTLTRRFHSTRSLGAALVLMCFFLAMLVTNDVSLLTLVPLTIALFRSMPEVCIQHRSSRYRCGKPRLLGYPDGESAEPLYLLAFQHAGRGFLPGNAASNGAQPCAAPALRADYPPQ